MSERKCAVCAKTQDECKNEGIRLWPEPSKGRSICHTCREIEIEDEIAEFQETDTDTDYTDEIICPHCGYENDRSEIDESDDDMTCGHCGREFSMEMHVQVHFTTVKK